MGRPYYYFVASLPRLEFEGKPSMPVESFLDDCRRLLAQEDFFLMRELLSKGASGIETSHAFLKALAEFDNRLRNETAWFRASRLHKDPSQHIRGTRSFDPSLTETVHQASKNLNPLETQRQLDRCVWRFWDEVLIGHYYDIEVLFIYGLKLKMLERYQAYASSKGREILEKLKAVELPESCALHPGGKVS
jgi:hypothetical protein